jgi:hypothetical protein
MKSSAGNPVFGERRCSSQEIGLRPTRCSWNFYVSALAQETRDRSGGDRKQGCLRNGNENRCPWTARIFPKHLNLP